MDGTGETMESPTYAAHSESPTKHSGQHILLRLSQDPSSTIDMGEGNGASAAQLSTSSSCRRGPGACGLALGRLVRRLRRRSKMLCTAARPAGASGRCHQYDPLSYARNFDRDGFGTGLEGDEVSGHLSHHCTFASRFVLASSSSGTRQQPQ